MCSDLPSPTFQSASTLSAPSKYIGTSINLKFCLPFPFYYILFLPFKSLPPPLLLKSTEMGTVASGEWYLYLG